MDPLSITTAVAALLKLTGTLVWELKKFHDDAQEVDKTLRNLLRDVERFDTCLRSMRETFEGITAQTQTGSAGELWTNIARSLGDGVVVMSELQQKLQSVNKDTKFLSSARKQWRLILAEDDIEVYREQISSFRDCLSLSMQTVIIHNQIFKETSHNQQYAIQVLPSLNSLEESIRHIASETNRRIEAVQVLLESGNGSPRITVLSNLRSCLQASADVVSAASSAAENDAMTVDGSVLDGYTSSKSDAMMSRWLDNLTVNGDVEEPAIQEAEPRHRTRSIAPAWDDPLEIEITHAMLGAAKTKIDEKDAKGAEDLLTTCMARMKLMPVDAVNAEHWTGLNLTAADMLLKLYRAQERWNDAVAVFKIILVSRRRAQTDEKPPSAAQLYDFAGLLSLTGDLVEAQLYARQALKISRETKTKDQGIELRTLKLLVWMCKDQPIDKAAFTYMLKEAEKQLEIGKTRWVRALYDFAAEEPGELSFRAGDVIEVIETVFRQWWKGRLHGAEGVFPVNYVQRVDPHIERPTAPKAKNTDMGSQRSNYSNQLSSGVPSRSESHSIPTDLSRASSGASQSAMARQQLTDDGSRLSTGTNQEASVKVVQQKHTSHVNSETMLKSAGAEALAIPYYEHGALEMEKHNDHGRPSFISCPLEPCPKKPPRLSKEEFYIHVQKDHQPGWSFMFGQDGLQLVRKHRPNHNPSSPELQSPPYREVELPMLRLNGTSKTRTVAIVGMKGAGKTALLRCWLSDGKLFDNHGMGSQNMTGSIGVRHASNVYRISLIEYRNAVSPAESKIHPDLWVVCYDAASPDSWRYQHTDGMRQLHDKCLKNTPYVLVMCKADLQKFPTGPFNPGLDEPQGMRPPLAKFTTSALENTGADELLTWSLTQILEHPTEESVLGGRIRSGVRRIFGQ